MLIFAVLLGFLPPPDYAEQVRAAWALANTQAAVRHEWHRYDDDPDGAYLFQDGKQIGAWYDKGFYRPFDAVTGAWGPKQPLPVGLPKPPAASQAKPRLLPFAPILPWRQDGNC